MAGNLTIKYGSSNQTVTITLNNMSSGFTRQSAAIDNSTTLYHDVLVSLKVTTLAGGSQPTGQILVFALGSVDGGTTYTENGTGSDAALTLVTPPNALGVGFVEMPNAGTVVWGGPWSVAEAFGGILPQFFSLAVQNRTSVNLGFTAGDNVMTYQGVYKSYT